ncbi:UDP-3-O-[3-hydroxymyristoyl] N-acetylglucosamine deacetylase [Candidatus Babeliales bacterium]|nr:UDP-3-O-[3-hydroxymyristoyl] N-acetylglucosamine deacetylase [Candidatus Babeliales bacterium]
MKQRTLNNKICFEGVGVHLGLSSSIILNPAPADSGIIFVNSKFPKEKIKIGNIIPQVAMHASVIKSENWMLSTVEHLMATINAFGIDNLLIEVDGFEIPILDGSALSFAYEIECVGLKEQDNPKKFLTPKKVLEFKDQKDDRYIKIIPARFFNDINSYDTNLYFDYLADFAHPLVRQNRLHGIMSADYFIENIAPARTFGFLEQLPFLRRHGLAKGTTLGNTVVIGEEEFLNDRRFKDEFVRHKFLDLIGDLALLGKNLIGTVNAKKTGHNFNRLVIEHYINNPDMWMLI